MAKKSKSNSLKVEEIEEAMAAEGALEEEIVEGLGEVETIDMVEIEDMTTEDLEEISVIDLVAALIAHNKDISLETVQNVS